jgi:hypothetical protein
MFEAHAMGSHQLESKRLLLFFLVSSKSAALSRSASSYRRRPTVERSFKCVMQQFVSLCLLTQVDNVLHSWQVVFQV